MRMQPIRIVTTLRQTFEVSSVRQRFATRWQDTCRLPGVSRLIASIVETLSVYGKPLMIEGLGSRTHGIDPMKLAAAEVRRRMDWGERFAFVDARTIEEWIESARRIAGSVRMTPSEVAERVKAVPQGRTIVTYCSSAHEESSTRVAVELMRLGFLNVHPLIGGLNGWLAAGGPVERM